MSFQDENINELMSIFQVESEEILERIFENLQQYEKSSDNKELSAALYRDLHSIKGALRMVGFNNLQDIIHKIEDIFEKINTLGFVLDKEKFTIITRALEFVLKYVEESVKNQREIIGDEFKQTISTLEYICNVDLAETTSAEVVEDDFDPIAALAAIANAEVPLDINLGFPASTPAPANPVHSKPKAPPAINNVTTEENLQIHQEQINFAFNKRVYYGVYFIKN